MKIAHQRVRRKCHLSLRHLALNEDEGPPDDSIPNSTSAEEDTIKNYDVLQHFTNAEIHRKCDATATASLGRQALHSAI